MDIVATIISSLGAALISAVASIVVCTINNNKQNALMFYRLEQLEKKVDKHNHLVERMYDIERRVTLVEEKENYHG